MRRIRFATVASVALIVGSIVSATTVRRLSMPELARSADLIALVRVGPSQSHWNTAHNLINTYTTLYIEERWKGAPAENQLTVREWGGVADGVRMRVSGAPRLELGSEHLLFLEADRQEPGVYLILGLFQGDMRVTTDPRSGVQRVSAPATVATVNLRQHTFTADGPVSRELSSFRSEIMRRAAREDAQ